MQRASPISLHAAYSISLTVSGVVDLSDGWLSHVQGFEVRKSQEYHTVGVFSHDTWFIYVAHELPIVSSSSCRILAINYTSLSVMVLSSAFPRLLPIRRVVIDLLLLSSQ